MKINNLGNNFIKGFNKVESIENDKSMNFANIIKEKLNDVNEKQVTAEQTTEEFIRGEDVDIHQVMIATQEAKLSLELAVQVRNSLVDAYKEINRMQI